MLGDANIKQSSNKKSCCIRFRQSIIHKEYLLSLYKNLSTKGYCSLKKASKYKVKKKN